MAIDITTGNFQSGKRWVSFKEADAAAGEQQLVSRDNTTGSNIQLFWVQLSCVTGGLAIMDGSGGLAICRVKDNTDAGVGWGFWDFRDDPLMLRSDATSLCISCVGTINGFVKYGFG